MWPASELKLATSILKQSAHTKFYTQLNLLKTHICAFSQRRGLTSVSKKEDQENILYVTGEKTHKETRINKKPVEMGVPRGEGPKVLQHFHKWQPWSPTRQPSPGQNLRPSSAGPRGKAKGNPKHSWNPVRDKLIGRAN